jgi:hypothetical protein
LGSIPKVTICRETRFARIDFANRGKPYWLSQWSNAGSILNICFIKWTFFFLFFFTVEFWTQSSIWGSTVEWQHHWRAITSSNRKM